MERWKLCKRSQASQNENRCLLYDILCDRYVSCTNNILTGVLASHLQCGILERLFNWRSLLSCSVSIGTVIILGYQLITGEKEVLSQLSCLTTSDLSIAVSVDVSIATDRVILWKLRISKSKWFSSWWCIFVGANRNQNHLKISCSYSNNDRSSRCHLIV